MTIREMEWSDTIPPIRDFAHPAPPITTMPIDVPVGRGTSGPRLDDAVVTADMATNRASLTDDLGDVAQMYTTYIRELLGVDEMTAAFIAIGSIGAAGYFAWRAFK